MTADPSSGAVLASFLFLLLVALSVAFFLAIIAIRRLRHERDALTHQKEVIFGFIHDVGEAFAYNEHVDLDRMLERVLFYACRTTRAAAGAVYLYDKEATAFRARAVSGLFPPLQEGIEGGLEKAVSKSQRIEEMVRAQWIQKGEGLIGEAADFCAPILIENGDRDPRIPHYQLDFLRIRSMIVVPMRFLQKVVGVIAVVNRVDGNPFVQEDLSLLQALGDQASVSVHYADLRDSLDEKQRIDHDLNVARQIQTALLPKAIPRLEGIELAAFNHPAQQIGGDYYDFICIDEERLGIAIADVSGKGIVGAIMMAISRSVLRAQATMHHSPAEVLKSVNRVMFEDIAEDMFVSMCYMVLNTRTRELVVARAGHERPVWFKAEERTFSAIDAPGIALGIADREVFEATLSEESVLLQPGDVVVAYTDGITEAQDAQREEWGVDAFLEAVHTAAPDGANAVLNNVQQRLMRFVGGVEQYDDMTLLAIRVLS